MIHKKKNPEPFHELLLKTKPRTGRGVKILGFRQQSVTRNHRTFLAGQIEELKKRLAEERSQPQHRASIERRLFILENLLNAPGIPSAAELMAVLVRRFGAKKGDLRPYLHAARLLKRKTYSGKMGGFIDIVNSGTFHGVSTAVQNFTDRSFSPADLAPLIQFSSKNISFVRKKISISAALGVLEVMGEVQRIKVRGQNVREKWIYTGGNVTGAMVAQEMLQSIPARILASLVHGPKGYRAMSTRKTIPKHGRPYMFGSEEGIARYEILRKQIPNLIESGLVTFVRKKSGKSYFDEFRLTPKGAAVWKEKGKRLNDYLLGGPKLRVVLEIEKRMERLVSEEKSLLQKIEASHARGDPVRAQRIQEKLIANREEQSQLGAKLYTL